MTGTTAFFGKVPFAPDFVRLGISPSHRSFEDWVHDGYADLRGAGARGLPARSHLLFPARDGSGVTAAVAIPSRDRVGREFPAVVATTIPEDQVPTRRSGLIFALQRFWDECDQAVQQHAQSDVDSLWGAVQTVRAPTDEELSSADRKRSSELENSSARAMEQACFSTPDDRFYAYHTLRLATRDAPPPEPRVLLCPTADQAQYRAFWADVIERASPRSLELPMLWMDGEPHPGALVVGLGRAHRSMLKFAAGYGKNANTLWPLSTEYDSAREQAKATLHGQFWDDPEQKLGKLVETILRVEV